MKALCPAIHEVCAAVLRRGADSPLGSRLTGIIGMDLLL